MDYSIFKLQFPAGVHFGNGFLNDSVYTFASDTLFSALYIEALKMQLSDELFEAVKIGKLLFSDAMPYRGNQYMVPKPIFPIEHTDNSGSSIAKKKHKNLKYLPVESFALYLQGKWEADTDPMENFGEACHQTMAAVRKEDDTLPFHVGTYYFKKGNGLYVIIAYQSEKELELAETLLQAVSLVGIGGKRASGLGKFELFYGKNSSALEEMLNRQSGYYMTLSMALPQKDELPQALEGSTYLLAKRSGFVASDTYAEEQRRKRDLYVFVAGSCFKNRFSGDIYDVSAGGGHAVYRYAKPLFMGV